jgi:hypothetical protein
MPGHAASVAHAPTAREGLADSPGPHLKSDWHLVPFDQLLVACYIGDGSPIEQVM